MAALELESMAESWKNLRTRFGETPPDAFDGNALYAPTLQETGDDIDAALTAIDDGKEQDAAVRLAPIALKISALRRASGFYRLGDCLLDASAAMDALFVFKTTPPDLAKAEIGADVIGKAAVYRAALRRCDTMAPGKIREEPEFRRLVDGADASLARVPEAVVTADGGLLYRLLIELKSFDRLLFFRFG